MEKQVAADIKFTDMIWAAVFMVSFRGSDFFFQLYIFYMGGKHLFMQHSVNVVNYFV